MNVNLFFAYIKIFHSVFGSVSLPMGRYSNMNQSSRAATENFVFLNAANNGSLKTNCCFVSRARWNALAKNRPASRQEKGFFEVWPVGLIFFIFTNGACTCFCEEKAKIFARATRSNHKTAASLKIYLLFALDTANLVAFFAEVWQKCTNIFLVQPSP